MMSSPGRPHEINRPGDGALRAHGVDHRHVKRKSLFPAMLPDKKRAPVKPPAEFLVKRDESALADEQREVDRLLVEEIESPANTPRRQSLPSRVGVRLHSANAADLCRRIISVPL